MRNRWYYAKYNKSAKDLDLMYKDQVERFIEFTLF